MSTAPSLCSVYFPTPKGHPCLYQPTQHNIPPTLPISCMQIHERFPQNRQNYTYVSDITKCHSTETGLFANIHTIVLRCVIPVVLSQILQCIICMYLHIYSVRNTTIKRWYHYVIYITVQYTTTCFGLINGPSSDCW